MQTVHQSSIQALCPQQHIRLFSCHEGGKHFQMILVQISCGRTVVIPFSIPQVFICCRLKHFRWFDISFFHFMLYLKAHICVFYESLGMSRTTLLKNIFAGWDTGNQPSSTLTRQTLKLVYWATLCFCFHFVFASFIC